MKFFLCVALAASVGVAGVITTPGIQITGPGGSNSAPHLTDTLSLSVPSGYSFTGTGCFDGYCPGQGTEGAGPNFTVNDPLTFRATAITVTCNSTTTCGATDIDFFFSFNTVSQTPGTILPVTFSVDGTAPNLFSFNVEGASSNSSCTPSCSGVDSGIQSISADGTGQFSQTFNLGNLTINGGLLKANLVLSLTGLGAGQSITMPNSMVLQIGSASGAPEPSTLALMLAGMGGLGLLLRRRRS